MRTLEFAGTAKSVSATSVSLKINNIAVDLARNGDTWSGKKKIDVDQNASVNFTARGFDGTKWSLEVDIDCPDGPSKILSGDGTIGGSGISTLVKDVPVPSDPCKNSNGN